MSFVREQVRRCGALPDDIRLTQEPNLTTLPILDGAFPNVREALVRGVIPAKDEACRLGYGHLKIGFNAVPTVGPQDAFWSATGRLGGR
ncbi:hypothetical protein [Rubrobacter calidifluminis]|uniref:hypothetical protein n=1 Tax=Rubrobacter calidifluminis TaxID=1392640 RepID=UPI00235F5995|nr:hypothetical protein [Rubrobacter calidifluminis]